MVAERGEAAAHTLAKHSEYVQAVAAETGTFQAFKAVMLMGSYYESRYRATGAP